MYTLTVNGKRIRTNAANLLDALRENGIFPDSPCGGRGTCGKCAVYIDGQKALACKTAIHRDMAVMLPSQTGSSIQKCGRRRPFINLSDSGLGLAFDIGTTTIAGYLVNLADGEILKTAAETNLQKAYGADVMSRIEYCMKNGTDELCRIVRGQIENISSALAEGLSIKRTVIAANTVMSHIYMNADVTGLAAVPFKPSFLDAQTHGSTTLMPCISPYIGGDITSSMLACGMDTETRTVMLVDLGTNGEVALHHKGTFYCCSSAAGPALEGAGISCGCGSVNGAVCGFEFASGIPSLKTINQCSPVGICGSGLVDIVAALLDSEVLDQYGTFRSKTDLAPTIRRYLSDNGFNVGNGIFVTQNDIREFQTVKSAIYSGIIMLCEQAGVSLDDISEVYLCGGLGSSINVKSACRTGLLPSAFDGKTTVCGNTSGMGAADAVCDTSVIELGDELRKRARIVETGGTDRFRTLFIDSLNFRTNTDFADK